MFEDFKELLCVFNDYQVRYLIVGGYAVSFHTQPRATNDLDILIAADDENGRAVYAALARFGAPVEGLSGQDFTAPGSFFRMGAPPFIARQDLRSAKLSAGRAQDLADVAELRENQDDRQNEANRSPSRVTNVSETIEEIQARSRENWLKLLEKSADRSAAPSPGSSKSAGLGDTEQHPGAEIDDDQ